MCPEEKKKIIEIDWELKKPGYRYFFCVPAFCNVDEPKPGPDRDPGDCLQSRNMPFGTSGDYRNRVSAKRFYRLT